jgi:DNA-binding NtrC family response regulator
VLTKLSVESGLRKAGYSATAVSSPDALDRAMRDSTWDLVVADLRDIDAVRTRLHGDTRPAVLVVVFDAPSDVVKTAKRTYHGVVKSPTHCATLVSAVDEALLDRAEAIGAANRKSR